MDRAHVIDKRIKAHLLTQTPTCSHRALLFSSRSFRTPFLIRGSYSGQLYAATEFEYLALRLIFPDQLYVARRS